jgi:hypothetical protein
MCTPYPARLIPYPMCNLEVIRQQFIATEEGFAFAYDAATHELVGAWFNAHTRSLRCGDKAVVNYRAGIVPPPDCAPSATQTSCRNDAGDADANDEDSLYSAPHDGG